MAEPLESFESLFLTDISGIETELNSSELIPENLFVTQRIGVTSKVTLANLSQHLRNNINLTGVPLAPTAIIGTNTDQIATTRFVNETVGSLGLNPATDNVFGTVKTDQFDNNPTVYLTQTVDTLLNLKANTTQLSAYMPVSGGAFTGNVTVQAPSANNNPVRLTDLNLHVNNSSNPHNTTATQVGRDTAQWNADRLRGVNIQNLAPTNEQTLVFSSSQNRWEPVSFPNINALQNLISSAVNAARESLFPVGSIYTNAINPTNPGTLLGFGTWVAVGQGRVPVGFDANDPDFDAAEKVGGEKKHTLTESELAAHTHNSGRFQKSGKESNGFGLTVTGAFANRPMVATNANDGQGAFGEFDTGNSGDSEPHNNLQPYIVWYFWKRVA